jgi:hypothetical protein
MKINFTKDHMARLMDLADAALFDRTTVVTKLGQPLNIYELLHTTSINQLNEIKTGLAKKIEKIEASDEWIAPDNDKLQSIKDTKELVNLIIGWKRYNFELAENERRIAEIDKQLNDIDEATKTPEDKKKELLAEKAKLTEFK